MELVTVASGVHACLQPEGGLGASNSGFVDRGGGLVVDSFWDLPRTRALMAHYAEVNPQPSRRLVNTHHNGDHAWGNQLFAEVGTELIGHRACAEHMSDSNPRREDPKTMQSLADAADTLPPSLAPLGHGLRRFDFRDVVVTPPTTLLDHDTVLDLDGTAVQLMVVGPAHTASDVAVFLPDEGVLFTGDVLFNRCTPIGWEGTFGGWISALERLAALEPETVVPGHGPIGDADDLLEMRDYLAYVFVEAREHYDAGRSTLEAAKQIDLARFAGWEEPERIASQLDRAYREFEGLPWDTGVDIGKVFGEMGELRAQWS